MHEITERLAQVISCTFLT